MGGYRNIKITFFFHWIESVSNLFSTKLIPFQSCEKIYSSYTFIISISWYGFDGCVIIAIHDLESGGVHMCNKL